MYGVGGAGPGESEKRKSLNGAQGKALEQGLWGRSPLAAEAKCKISVTFSTFSCTKFWIK